MINVTNQNYSETLSQIAELQDLMVGLEKNISAQLPQGISSKFTFAKDAFMNWVEEAEFTLQNYKI